MWGFDQVFKFKGGPGVVGRTSHVVLLLIIAISFFGFLIGDIWARIGLAAALFVFVGAWVWKAFDYGEKNPGIAMTEGGEFVRYIEAQNAKGLEISALPKDLKTISSPAETKSKSLPKPEGHGDE